MAAHDTYTGTWHHGLVARWWAQFNEPEAHEVAYLRSAIETYGQPALDVGCGAGRLTLPLLKAGLHVDGADVSADMLAYAQAAADSAGFKTVFRRQAIHELDMPYRYRTVFVVGTFGIGGDREHDWEGLNRIYRHLEPGGALLINHELPWAAMGERQWQLWRSARSGDLPRPWPQAGDRKSLPDGDEIELLIRTSAFDRLAQVMTMDMRARLWRDGKVVREEESQLREGLYFAHEVEALLRATGFESIEIESGYSGQPATADDNEVMFVARKP